jgi:putative transposase
MLPKDFPPWQTVYDHFSRCNKRGVWEAALKSEGAQVPHRRGYSRQLAPCRGSCHQHSRYGWGV